MRVIHLTRKPQEGFHSFERLFAEIRLASPDDIEVSVVYSWFHSRGIVPRLLNCLQAMFLRADVIHVTGDVHYLTPALIGRRAVLTIHDLAPLRPKTGRRRRIFRSFWYVWPLRTASVVTTVSKSVRREMLDEFGSLAAKIVVVPNCISRHFKYSPKAWPQRPVILMVGTRPQKNIERMCQAMDGLPVEVRIVGPLTTEQHACLQALNLYWTELGRLSDDQLLQAYRDCDLLAFASTYEGFGLPILEAQATGRPVLTSDTNTLREVTGGAACFVDPRQIDSIRRGLEQILADEAYRSQLVKQGLKNAKRYSVEATAQAYAAEYRQIAGSGESGARSRKKS